MERELKKYNKYKNDIKFMLIGSGLWPDYYKHPEHLRTFLSLLSAFANTAMTYFVIMFCVNNFTNISVLVKGLGPMISYLSATVKVIVLIVHKYDVLSLNKGVSAQFEKDLEKPEYRKHLLAYFPAFARFFYIYDYAVAVTFIMLVLKPLIILRQGTYVRTYTMHIPFKYEPGGIIHWSLYAFEVLCAYYCWSLTTGVDSVFGLYALHMNGELRLLSHLLENLKFGKDYKRNLIVCVEKHAALMESQKVMQRVFGFLSLWLAITCAIVVCAIIFQFSEMQHIPVYKLINLLTYCFLKLVQAYQYAWFGNAIAVESELCLNSVYKCGWVNSLNLRFMNDVLIVQSQKVMRFNASGLLLVRLDMFSKILQTSVSYFFLLKTLEVRMVDKS